MQDASTSQMIFTVAYLIAFLSEVITLEPGDVLATGTPSGVGSCHDPPIFLKPGDDVEVRIEKVGVLRNGVAVEKGKRARASR
jgi:2-keto-4-pentenoate hydratase/2-oxohepta-3-ene-1,7-dioic acid hydratase in catechol pathway